MVEKLIKCQRCKGLGNVRKYIINDYLDCILEIINAFISSLLYFPIYCTFYGIVGCFIGPIFFILLKTALPFYIFGNIFYFFGGLSIFYTIYTIFLKNIKSNIIIYIVSIFISIINLVMGLFLYKKKGGIYLLINFIYSSINGGAIGLVSSYLFYKKDMLEENNNRVKCPLCSGKKFLSQNDSEKLERCKNCSKNCGYENPKKSDFFLHKRFFCKICNGKGYIFKNN